jgi:hypothetical protein
MLFYKNFVFGFLLASFLCLGLEGRLYADAANSVEPVEVKPLGVEPTSDETIDGKAPSFKAPVTTFKDLLPPAEKGTAIGENSYILAGAAALVGFILLTMVIVLVIWFGLAFLIVGSLLGSAGFLIYGLSQGTITTWEQLMVAIFYLAIVNALLIIPIRALLPEKA